MAYFLKFFGLLINGLKSTKFLMGKSIGHNKIITVETFHYCNVKNCGYFFIKLFTKDLRKL